MHDYARQQRQSRFEMVPDPAREDLAGRIVESWNVVEVVMVELFGQRRERAFDLGKVHDPAQIRVERTTHADLDAERVAVQTRALVSGRHPRKAVG